MGIARNFYRKHVGRGEMRKHWPMYFLMGFTGYVLGGGCQKDAPAVEAREGKLYQDSTIEYRITPQEQKELLAQKEGIERLFKEQI